MSDYYDHGSAPADNSFGDPAVIRAEFDLITQNISGKLPPLTANGDKILAVNAGATALVAVTTTGTGNAVRATSPTLVTPALGTPSSGVATNLTGLPLSSGVTGTLPVANGGTGVTSSTGSGNNVLSNGPTLVAPVLGTPASGVATNLTGLPLTTGVTGTLPVANGGTGAVTAGAALTALGAAASGANSDIISLTALTNGIVGTSGNQTIAGVKTFSSDPIFPTPTQKVLDTANGYGGGASNKIRRMANIQVDVGTTVTVADDVTNGMTITINVAGIYAITYVDNFSAPQTFGLSLNAASLTNGITALALAQRIGLATTAAADLSATVAATRYFAVNDVIRLHSQSATSSGVSPALTLISVVKLH